MKANKMSENLNDFLLRLDSLYDTLPMTLILLSPEFKKTDRKFEEFRKNKLEEVKENGEKAYSLKVEDYPIFKQLVNNSNTLSIAPRIISESLFVSLVSQYDAFFAKLLRAIYLLVPNIIESSDRNISFTQLAELGSIEAAKGLIIEKEIETILRKNHKEHFEYLETKLKMTFTKDLPIFTTFIELSERRNLFVHCDGVVSNQYLKVCNDNKCNISDIKIGDKLTVDFNYFKKAYSCLYEISVKLTHTIWRKLCSKELKNADEELNSICYNLLMSKRLKLADILLSFARGQKKHSTEANKNIFIINAALSKYLQKNKEEAVAILKQKDWSACSDDFKLANEVLTENYDACYKLMKKIGVSGDVLKVHYRQWPLFEIIRELKEFKECYFEVFNEDFKVIEIPLRPIESLLDEKKKQELEQVEDVSKLPDIPMN